MASGSQKPTFSQYGVNPACEGCGRKLVAKDEPAMWFRGLPAPAGVFGYCCWGKAT